MKRMRFFFAGHAKSSAALISLVIHAVLIVVALSFVAVSVIIKEDRQFEVKTVSRPKLPLKKLQVPVKLKKSAPKPKLRKLIISKPKTVGVDIQLPELAGIKGGLGSGAGEGLSSIGFNFEIPDLFGSNARGSGNEFLGHFYDLKQTKDGDPTDIGKLVAKAKPNDLKDPHIKQASELYREVIRRFLSGWSSNRLNKYFMAPREKFATTFIIPKVDAEEAPAAFGVGGQVTPMQWLAVYRGQIVAPETGRYRFCGRGDDVLAVRVKKNLVLDASYSNISDWESDDPDNYKYDMYASSGVVIGDWFVLQKGKAVPMEVLIGEEPGGVFFCQLYIEQQGVTYPTRTETYTDKESKKTETLQRPIFPIFKTAEMPAEVVEKMQINPNWATVEGPSFGLSK